MPRAKSVSRLISRRGRRSGAPRPSIEFFVEGPADHVLATLSSFLKPYRHESVHLTRVGILQLPACPGIIKLYTIFKD